MSNRENQEKIAERLEDLPRPEEELTAEQAENPRGGLKPTYTVGSAQKVVDSLLSSEGTVFHG